MVCGAVRDYELDLIIMAIKQLGYDVLTRFSLIQSGRCCCRVHFAVFVMKLEVL